MIKLITGKKGSGKTKVLIDMINEAAKSTRGNIVCIEKGAKLTYDIDHSVRLTDTDHFGISGYDSFYGFIAGMFAGNFDISEVYVDSILKIGDYDLDGLGKLLEKLSKISGSEIKLVFTVSVDESELPDNVKAFLK